MKERRNELRVALDHMKTGLDLIHIALEHLPDPKGDGCDSLTRCIHCDPVCAGIHALRSAQHWVNEGADRLSKLEGKSRLDNLEAGWRTMAAVGTGIKENIAPYPQR